MDLAAGLAFGLTNVGNCLVLAVDAAVGELQLLRFVNNTRSFLERTAMNVPVGEWCSLEVAVSGEKITAKSDAGASLIFTAPQPVSGHVGLWTKGDTSAYFRNLVIDVPGRKN